MTLGTYIWSKGAHRLPQVHVQCVDPLTPTIAAIVPTLTPSYQICQVSLRAAGSRRHVRRGVSSSIRKTHPLPAAWRAGGLSFHTEVIRMRNEERDPMSPGLTPRRRFERHFVRPERRGSGLGRREVVFDADRSP
jgi:hypothetical protein